ncbi:hypothetical protein JDN40_00850 [Rhodomicrobium vannielii ATCC 17100]|uniref:hypothetical protein n=1 Tax=Rhodomicrobium vannielii TaxID=1069 RepID=UPI00191B630E|nr:hypothetical protein [Rhodomicrobium vannielii]MBJ7532679.1 hypothetical protein [Rhodomicrobium vannielii ATCC 17100]
MENEIRQIASDLVEVIVRLQFLAVEAGKSGQGSWGEAEAGALTTYLNDPSPPF